MLTDEQRERFLQLHVEIMQSLTDYEKEVFEHGITYSMVVLFEAARKETDALRREHLLSGAELLKRSK